MRFWLALAFVPTDQLVPLARAAEEAGFEGVTLSDHLFYPRDLRSAYPYSADGSPPFGPDTPWPDPWVAIGAMAAVTTKLRFTTNVYVAPARDVVSVAKLVSTAAVLSEGRVMAGFSAGWMREEFEATGQDFETRGRRLDEMITSLRTLWAGRWTEIDGVGSVKIEPVPTEPIRILIGGDSPAALRRAAHVGDGWIANALTVERAEERLSELDRLRKDAGRDGQPFEVVAPILARPDGDLINRLAKLGVTGMIVAPWAPSRDYQSDLESKLHAIARFAPTLRSSD
jgi:probable F420-dependent oxidoreductase